jgi:polyhydroxyalkanoate synthesis regulator protein
MQVVRYKNGSLYCRETKQWLTLADLKNMPKLDYTVTDSKTKNDITAEVSFLADVDYVRRSNLWSHAAVVLTAFQDLG